MRWLLSHKPRCFTIVSLDESVFIQDVEVRRVWAMEATRPIRIAAANMHGRTVLFGAMSLDGRQLFRQYKRFDGRSFLDYLKKVHRKFRKLYLFMDRAPQHRKTRKMWFRTRKMVDRAGFEPAAFRFSLVLLMRTGRSLAPRGTGHTRLNYRP